jgi:hypothetical protein
MLQSGTALLVTPGSLVPFVKTGPFAWNGLLSWWMPVDAKGVPKHRRFVPPNAQQRVAGQRFAATGRYRVFQKMSVWSSSRSL